MSRRSIAKALLFVLLVLAYWQCVGHLNEARRVKADLGTSVKLPIFADVMLTGGDRFLAANVSTVRAMVAFVEPQANTPEGLAVIGALQEDVSRLNPGHEDNYYLAAASLIGTPGHAQGQRILRRAIDARPFDYLPPFFYAVNRMFYDRAPIDGAHWLRIAAARNNDEEDRANMEKIAARWLVKGGDPEMAASVLDMLAQQARTPSLREHFVKRAQQARDLLDLQRAVQRYSERYGRPPGKMEDLVTTGILARLPKDPFGNGYELSSNGTPVVRSAPRSIGG